MITLQNYPRITPFLWFDSNAEEAVDFYLTVFQNARRHTEVKLGEPGQPKPKVHTIGFELDGLSFTAINGGPYFKFNEAVSFVVRCDSQAEIDHYWEKLTADGGKESQCGWLKDKFGLSWQIVPGLLPELIRHPAALQAMLKMKKLDIAALELAAKS
jgi:predicted 3-demethylubiquinone-9 3-methyltransferase (glyoxalase superfamily)